MKGESNLQTAADLIFMEKKISAKLKPGIDVIKLFAALIYDFSNKLVSVPGKPFKPSLMFASTTGAYLREVPFRCCSLVLASCLTHKH